MNVELLLVWAYHHLPSVVDFAAQHLSLCQGQTNDIVLPLPGAFGSWRIDVGTNWIRAPGWRWLMQQCPSHPCIGVRFDVSDSCTLADRQAASHLWLKIFTYASITSKLGAWWLKRLAGRNVDLAHRATHCKGLYPLVLGKLFLVCVMIPTAVTTSSEAIDLRFHAPPSSKVPSKGVQPFSAFPPFQGASKGHHFLLHTVGLQVVCKIVPWTLFHDLPEVSVGARPMMTRLLWSGARLRVKLVDLEALQSMKQSGIWWHHQSSSEGCMLCHWHPWHTSCRPKCDDWIRIGLGVALVAVFASVWILRRHRRHQACCSHNFWFGVLASKNPLQGCDCWMSKIGVQSHKVLRRSGSSWCLIQNWSSPPGGNSSEGGSCSPCASRLK